jgi:phosphate transport system substrate-binding protein
MAYRNLRRFVAAACLAAVGLGAAQDGVRVDTRIPEYRPVEGVSGSIKSVGSDTMNNLMALWAEGFRKMYPNIQAEIEGKGSSTAPPALISGASTFGPMSRLMKDAEVDKFEERFGYKPTVIRTSIDMLAVYVHKDNPIAQTGLSLEQLDGIFSKTNKSGHADVKTWGDLGLTGEWANKPISMYGRNSASGTYGYFKKHALFDGDYKDTVKEQPGSSAVVQGVANDKFGIGYSGIGYKTADVAVVPLAPDMSSQPVPATAETVADYPLARFLYLYLNYRPGSRLDPLRGEYLKYIFSQEGQLAVLKDGYLPVTAKIAAEDLAKVNLRLGQ